jgi:predicted RNA-binding Zn-ribbon protein involved in translation (DUF1610 family)
MKTILTYAIPVIVSLLMSSLVNGQTSKSCGACHRDVSAYSTVGQRCPHCGVIWGRENTTTRYVDSYSYNDYSYQNLDRIAFVTSNSNLRAYASKSAYVKTVVPKYAMVTVIGKYGDWYHVEYAGGWYSTERGYIHKSLIDL